MADGDEYGPTLLVLHQRLRVAPIAALVLVFVASIGVTRRRDPAKEPL